MSKIAENQDEGLFDIDFEPDQLSPKKGPGRWPDKNKDDDLPVSGTVSANINNIDDIDIDKIDSIDNTNLVNNNKDLENLELKKGLTPKENKFIALWLSGDYLTHVKAMKAAGYLKGSDSWINYIARNILIRFETLTENKRQIMRRLGAGEVRIIEEKLKLALTGRSEKVRNDALDSLAKWIGLSRDNIEVNQGDRIINIFNQELTRRYEVTNIVVNPSDHTANSQKRYELPEPTSDDSDIPDDK